MDYLIDGRSLDDFFKSAILPLCFYGIGSVSQILSMKMWEIRETLNCLNDEEVKEIYKSVKGLSLN